MMLLSHHTPSSAPTAACTPRHTWRPLRRYNSTRRRRRQLCSVRTPSSSMSEQQATAAEGAAAAAAGQQQQPTRFTNIGLEELRALQEDFAARRDWQQYHTPRNLLLALVGEVGELSEIFQWRGEVPPGLPGFSAAERDHVGQELSDVLLYLIRLSDVCGVDLGAAVRDKLAANTAKYPAERCRGSSAKYTWFTSGDCAGSNSSSSSQGDKDAQQQQQQQQQQEAQSQLQQQEAQSQQQQQQQQGGATAEP